MHRLRKFLSKELFTVMPSPALSHRSPEISMASSSPTLKFAKQRTPDFTFCYKRCGENMLRQSVPWQNAIMRDCGGLKREGSPAVTG